MDGKRAQLVLSNGAHDREQAWVHRGTLGNCRQKGGGISDSITSNRGHGSMNDNGDNDAGRTNIAKDPEDKGSPLSEFQLQGYLLKKEGMGEELEL